MTNSNMFLSDFDPAATGSEDEALRVAEVAAAGVVRGDHVRRFLEVGHGLLILRRRAMREARSDTPRGRRYSEAFATALRGYPALASIFSGQAVSDAIWCVENWPLCREAMAGITHAQQMADLNPRALRLRAERLANARATANDDTAAEQDERISPYQRVVGERDDARRRIAELEAHVAEIEAARRADAGDIYSVKDTPRNIARAFCEPLLICGNLRKLRETISEASALLKAAEAQKKARAS